MHTHRSVCFYFVSSFLTGALKKDRISFFCPASMTFGLTSLVFLGEGAPGAPGLGTPIASSRRSNSAYKSVSGQHSFKGEDVPLQ